MLIATEQPQHHGAHQQRDKDQQHDHRNASRSFRGHAASASSPGVGTYGKQCGLGVNGRRPSRRFQLAASGLRMPSVCFFARNLSFRRLPFLTCVHGRGRP
jgi:hypothetical protein